jgi:predicted RNA-binding Zn-ribbon protein involved in translation (DUF1610 family)
MYEEQYAASCGKFRLPVIQRAAEAFNLCGDWQEGIARIRCGDCGYDFFVPFSCKSFFLCPSCGQKRTLLLGEYLSEDLLLQLPHRQFVWTIPKCLRVFLKHDRELHAELSRLMFSLLSSYFSEAAGQTITAGMVSSLQTFGEYASWNPHWHTIVLEGGFDRWDRFVFIPLGSSDGLKESWRVRVAEFFVRQKLINSEFAKNMLSWKHSGFSIESGTRIYNDKARESLSQYIVRAPVSLKKLSYDSETDTITWKAPKKGHFKGKEQYFSGLDFIARLTLHIPPKGKHLVRRYGIYSSRSRGTWKRRPALALRAAEGWYGREDIDETETTEPPEEINVSARAWRKAWVRLLAKVYEIDIFSCPKCGGRMSIIAVIRDHESIREIIDCINKKGRGPPG